MIFPSPMLTLAQTVLDAAREKRLHIVTAESCTGGLIAACLTAIAGSSDVVERGFVTYSNEAKTEALGVSAATIQKKGAVSDDVARAMAEGALARARAQVAVSCTGIAGPGGGSVEKPIGLVYIAAARGGRAQVQEHRFGDIGRDGVRMKTVDAALKLLRDVL